MVKDKVNILAEKRLSQGPRLTPSEIAAVLYTVRYGLRLLPVFVYRDSNNRLIKSKAMQEFADTIGAETYEMRIAPLEEMIDDTNL